MVILHAGASITERPGFLGLKSAASWAQMRSVGGHRSKFVFPHAPHSDSNIDTGDSTLSGNIVYVTDDSFEAEIIKADAPVLVDYWADWCGPCKMIAPILDEIAEEYAGRLKVAKLNIDENPITPPKFGIRGIPTLMLFKNGNVEATKVGAVSKSQLTAFIDSNL
jgi:thioredoxin 1